MNCIDRADKNNMMFLIKCISTILEYKITPKHREAQYLKDGKDHGFSNEKRLSKMATRIGTSCHLLPHVDSRVSILYVIVNQVTTMPITATQCCFLRPVEFTARTAGRLIISCLAVLLFVYLDERIQTGADCGVQWRFLDVCC